MAKTRAHQKLPTTWVDRESLRTKGQFWTPDWVADAMVSYVAQDANLIFDPAVGRGAFLHALRKVDHSYHKQFYGTDVDDIVLTDEVFNQENCKVENRDFIKAPPSNKFDAIVANPPYIRHHRIDEKTKSILRELTMKIMGFTIDGRAGYHIYFLLQALSLLEKNGRLAFIMPADTCEGVFSKKLWDWIGKNYAIDCVATFSEDATPFPSVDTNALVFFIQNVKPRQQLFWIKANEAHNTDLFNFVRSNFTSQKFDTLDIVERDMSEALSTGLSRAFNIDTGMHTLKDFAKVMRGIATGGNEFFFLTKSQADDLNIPDIYLKKTIGRTRDAKGDIFTQEHFDSLAKHLRPTLLLSIDQSEEFLPETVKQYLVKGVELQLNERPLIKQRKPWFKMEKREIPPILFAYLGRRNTRFIKNEAGVIPLTGFLCVYPYQREESPVKNLWLALNHPDTIKNLALVGKSYGSGAIKVEPGNLSNLPIPDHIVKKFGLVSKNTKSTHQYHLTDGGI
jgi:adenine-specific DNA methylase